MSIYSYLGQEPQELPHRIRLDDGLTKTSLNELSPEELTILGFVLVTKPSYDIETQKIVWNSSAVEYQVESLSESELTHQKRLLHDKKLSQMNFNLFWNRFFGSSSYIKLRDSAESSTTKKDLLEKIHGVFRNALAGKANHIEINGCINLLFHSINPTDNEKEQIQSYITESGLDCIVNIPSADDISFGGFDSETNKILGPAPFTSWNIVGGEWKAPVDYPTDGGIYKWDENIKNWVSI